MIKIDELDKSKTYIGYQVGFGFVARAIQHKSAKLTNSNMPENKIASHVFAMAFKDGQWFVYESHLRSDGVAKFTFKDWARRELLDRNFVFEYPLDTFILEFYTKFNPGYSIRAIGKIALDSFSDMQKDKDSSGMICSEYITMAIPRLKPCTMFNLPPWEILPIHLQLMRGA